MDGWDRPTEIRVTQDGKIAFTAHNPPPTEGRNNGVSIVDVSDPSSPKVLARAVNPHGVHSQYVGLIGNILVLNQEKVRLDRVGGVRPDFKTWEPGIRLFDVSDPAKPREVGYFIPQHGGRPDLIVVTDEITRQCPWGYMRIIDIRYASLALTKTEASALVFFSMWASQGTVSSCS